MRLRSAAEERTGSLPTGNLRHLGRNTPKAAVVAVGPDFRVGPTGHIARSDSGLPRRLQRERTDRIQADIFDRCVLTTP